MKYAQVEALRLMIRKEVLAAVYEAELHMERGMRGRTSVRDIEMHIAYLREEARRHGQEAIE